MYDEILTMLMFWHHRGTNKWLADLHEDKVTWKSAAVGSGFQEGTTINFSPIFRTRIWSKRWSEFARERASDASIGDFVVGNFSTDAKSDFFGLDLHSD